MRAIPVKPEYGPTLGRMLSPRWQRASRPVQVLVMALCALVLAGAVGLFLTVEPAHYSRGGAVPFSFSYRGLYRVAPEPGGYVRVQSLWKDGEVKYSYAVNPLQLPPYTGAVNSALPLFATGVGERLARRVDDYVPDGEGKTRVNQMPAYQILYRARVGGELVYGRNVLLLPERQGARRGVEIAMLTAPGASSEVKSPSEVASAGVLLRPLKTFSFG